MGRVIAVSNAKGGIGKTTTVVNIGAGLALKGARVLLVMWMRRATWRWRWGFTRAARSTSC